MMNNLTKLTLSLISLTLIHAGYSAPLGALQPPTKIWGSIEYLNWQVKDASINAPLVTTSSPTDLGILNQPTTRVIYGDGSSNDDSVHFNHIPGMGVTLGVWLDACNQYGIEANGFWLNRQNQKTLISTDDFPVLAVPFFNTLTNSESSQILANPGSIFGSTWTNNSSRLWGADINGLFNLSNAGPIQYTALAGFRFLDLDESMNMTAKRRFLTPSVLPFNTELITNDYFGTQNHFYGVQVGGKAAYTYNKFVGEIVGKLALGVNAQTLDINGGTTTIFFGSGAPTTFIDRGGFFVMPSNSGTFHQNQFAVMPEVQAKLAYLVTAHIKPYVGYNFLYLTNVIRASGQVDRNINPVELPPTNGTTAASRNPQFHQSTFWAQGLNVGVEVSY